MDEDIKKVVSETIKELHADKSVQLRWPTTVQGWVYVVLGLGTVVGFLASTVVILNRISHHPDQPFHPGAKDLIEEFKEDIPTEEQLELKIIRETEPIKSDIQGLREDVGRIQTSVDILVEDARERRRNP